MNKIHPTPRIQLSAPAAAAPPIESMSVPIFDILSMGGAAAAAAGADRSTIWLDGYMFHGNMHHGHICVGHTA